MKKFLLAMLVLILAAAGFIFWLFARDAEGCRLRRAVKIFGG